MRLVTLRTYSTIGPGHGKGASADGGVAAAAGVLDWRGRRLYEMAGKAGPDEWGRHLESNGHSAARKT